MSLKDLTNTDAAAITQEFVQLVSPDLPLVRSRLCLIFGNRQRENVYNMATRAAQLYHQGMIKKIITTGGVRFADSDEPLTESQYARKILIARGVPPKAIYVENKSTNTRENVVFARRLIKRAEGTVRHETILCMGMNHATSRFLMTMAKNWPQAIASFIGFDRFDLPKDEWHTCENITTLLKQDHQKWPEYRNYGHIKPVDTSSLRRRLIATSKPKKLAP